MDVFWIPHLAILALLHQTMSASDPEEVFGVLGGSVTFRTYKTGTSSAFWNFGNDPIVAVEFKDPSKLVFYEDKFKTRFAVSEKGRALNISQLRMEDAGSYSVNIDKEKFIFTLRVFRELAEPTVTCEAQNCSGGSCSSSLRCSAPGPGADFGNVSYTWRVGGHTRDGSSVVLLVNETSQEPLMCTARNPVSSRNVTVTTPGALCAGSLSSSQVGVRAGLGVVAGIFVVLVLIFLLFLWKFEGWRKFCPSQPKPADTAPGATDNYATVYAEVGPSQQGVPDGNKAKPAEGGAPSTIYSLVKRPDQVDEGTAQNATMTGLELV